MPILEIPQEKDNPYDYLTQPKEWRKFEYSHGRGSMNELVSRVRRYTLYNEVRLELEAKTTHVFKPEPCSAQLKAWRYVLHVGEFDRNDI